LALTQRKGIIGSGKQGKGKSQSGGGVTSRQQRKKETSEIPLAEGAQATIRWTEDNGVSPFQEVKTDAWV